ncbi:hypothetical protein [Polymorphospora sp. NPDC050346]|uniref:hypothetical protein n=1 Tax=Polymorphospora sp. NPDC050346 TaxID=3155780 RepID=UPI0033F6AB04
MTSPPDIKSHLDDADSVVDALPWKLGDTEAARKRARGRVSALAHQVAGLLATGWTVQEIQQALATAPNAATAPDPAAQEKRWRSALKQARHTRRQTQRPPHHGPIPPDRPSTS